MCREFLPQVSSRRHLTNSRTAPRPLAYWLGITAALRIPTQVKQLMVPGVSSTSKFLSSQKFLADRSSLFFLLEKYVPDFRIPTKAKQLAFCTPTEYKKHRKFLCFFVFCRSAGIRTRSHLVPNQTC